MSNGRFILGTGLGVFRKDLQAAQVGHVSRAKINDEALEALRRLVHETNVTHRGDLFNFEDLTVLPRPVHKNSLPIWTSAFWDGKLREGPLRRAGKFADGFLNSAPVSSYRQCIERISDYAVSFGRDPGGMDWGCLMYTCLGESRERAWETLSRVVRDGSGRDPRPIENGCYAIGTADDCIESIQRYIEIGMTHFVISAKCPHRTARGDVPGLRRKGLASSEVNHLPLKLHPYLPVSSVSHTGAPDSPCQCDPRPPVSCTLPL